MKLLFGVALFFHAYILKKENLIKIIFNNLAWFSFNEFRIQETGDRMVDFITFYSGS